MDDISSVLQQALITSNQLEKETTLETSLQSLKDILSCLEKKDDFNGEHFFLKIKKFVQQIEEYLRKHKDSNIEQISALIYEIFSCFILLWGIDDLKDFVTLNVQRIVSAIKMLLKAIQVWLLNKNFVEATKCFEFTDYCMQRMKIIPKEESRTLIGKLRIEKYVVITDLFRLELAANYGKHNKALSLLSDIKDMIYNFPLLLIYLADFCYNNGIISFRSGNYELSILWLRQCYDLSKNEKLISIQMKQILMLLAESYMKLDANQYWQKAIHAIDLAYADNKETNYFPLCMQVIVRGGNESALEEYLNRIIGSSIADEQNIKIIGILLKYGHNQRALKLISAFKRRTSFTKSKEMLSLELKIYLDDNNLEDATVVIEQYIEKMKLTGNGFLPEDHRVCLLILRVASEYFKRKIFIEALSWYQYGINIHNMTLTVPGANSQLIWLKIQICYCYLETGALQKAKEILSEIEYFENENVICKFLALKISIFMEDEKLANTALDYLMKVLREEKDKSSTSSTIILLLINCCEIAAKNSKMKFTLQVFDNLATENLIDNPEIQLKVLRCLLRLHSSSTEGKLDCDRMLSYVRKSNKCLKAMKENKADVSEECLLLSKLCWNMATDKDMPIRNVFQLFSFGWKSLDMLNSSEVHTTHLKNNCLLMTISSGLYFSRIEQDQQLVKNTLNEILNMIEENKKEQLRSENKQDKTILKVLLLYEFETRMRLKSPKLETCFNDIKNLPFLDIKFFELLASLSVKCGLLYYHIAVKALKVAIMKQFDLHVTDFTKISRNFHSLLEIMMQTLTNNETHMHQETLGCVNEILEIVQKKADGQYPEIELAWTLVKCWNCGIRYFLQQNKQLAFEWCSVSMKYLQHLHSFKAVYENKMKNMFKDLFRS